MRLDGVECWQNSGMAHSAADILERMAAGQFAAHIARDIGVTKQAVSKRLLRCSTVEYRMSMQRGAAVRLLAKLRRSRDYGDVAREDLQRELLYCERWAPRLLQLHSALIRAAFRNMGRPPITGSRARGFQSPAVTAEILAMDSLRMRYLNQTTKRSGD